MSEEKRLEGIGKLTIGQRACLKREAGKRLQEGDAGALQAFFSILPFGTPAYEHEIYYAVACIACIWKEEETKSQKPFAECLSQIGKTVTLNGRFRALLDTTYQPEDGFLITKLCRLAKQLHNSDVQSCPDFELLLDDLLKWNSPSRIVQRRWMEAYLRQENID